ncbi:MAG: VOC family protein [Methanomassiliicoccales archaeon]|nr:VOC family protein [Methanomassiliicoccales archaeon]TFG54878.1 MAG: VOC family protein [Methanomassiliicoccus sp.]
MPTIVHFDVPAEDIKRASRFYSELFGWKIEPMPGPMEYYGIGTQDLEGKPSVGGGMGKRQEGDSGMVNYFGVDSIDSYVKKLERLGGKVLMPRNEIPGYGFLAVCLDTEGNKFGLWQN